MKRRSGDRPPKPEWEAPPRVEMQLEEIEDDAGAADLLQTILWAQAQEIARKQRGRGDDAA